MHQSADLRADLDRAVRNVLATVPESAELQRLADELTAIGYRITESVEAAYLDLTCEDEEAA
jgi:hypothetical protein